MPDAALSNPDRWRFPLHAYVAKPVDAAAFFAAIGTLGRFSAVFYQAASRN